MDKLTFRGIVLKIQNLYKQQQTNGYRVTIDLPNSPEGRKKAQQLYEFLNSPAQFIVEKDE